MSLYGRNIPSCVRRGVADALRVRLSERSYLKWAGRMNSGSVTLRDVVNLTHPKPKGKVQEALIKYALDEGYGKKGDDKQLPTIRARCQFLALDRSGSMSYPMSAKSSLSCQDTANVFASALAIRGESVRVVAFDDHMEDVKVASTDLLRVVDQMPTARGCTYTLDAVAYAHKKGEKYDRIIILTDEQYRGGSVDNALDTYAPRVPVFTWNLAGYATAQMEAREGRWTFGGLSDKGFQMIPLLERGIGQSWPWE